MTIRTVCVFPRCSRTRQADRHSKPRPPGKRRRVPLAFTLEALEQYYNVPQAAAANELGVSVTTMKQICRRLGIERWPYQRPCLAAGPQGLSRGERPRDASSEGPGGGGPTQDGRTSSEPAGLGAWDDQGGDGRASTPLSLSKLAIEAASSVPSSPYSISDSLLSSQSTPTVLRSRSFQAIYGQAQVHPSIALGWEPQGFPVRPTHLRHASLTSHQNREGDVRSSPGLPAPVPQEFSARVLPTSSTPRAGCWGRPAKEDVTRGDVQDCEDLLAWLPPPPQLLPRAHAPTCLLQTRIPCPTTDGCCEEDENYPLHVCF